MKRFGALFFLLLSSSLAAEPLTWDQIAAQARRDNPDLVAAHAASEQAEVRYRTALAAFFPTLTPAINVTHSDSRSLIDGQTVNSDNSSVSAGVTGSLNLFNGFADAALLKGRNAEIRSARAAEEETLARVGFDLRKAFNDYLFAQEQLALTTAIAKRRSEDSRLVSLRFDNGSENKGSSLRSKAQEREALYDEASARRATRVAERRLASLIGTDPFQTLEATGSLTAANINEEPNFRQLASDNPSFQRAAADLEASEQDVRVARGKLMPGLDASASYLRQGDNPAIDQSRTWTAGLRLAMPFSLGGTQFYDVKDARLTVDQRRAALQTELNTLAINLESAFADYQDAVERVQVAEQFLSAENVRAEIARQQYASGLLSFQDWDIIENELISEQKDRLSSLRDAATAEASWSQAKGENTLPPLQN